MNECEGLGLGKVRSWTVAQLRPLPCVSSSSPSPCSLCLPRPPHRARWPAPRCWRLRPRRRWGRSSCRTRRRPWTAPSAAAAATQPRAPCCSTAWSCSRPAPRAVCSSCRRSASATHPPRHQMQGAAVLAAAARFADTPRNRAELNVCVVREGAARGGEGACRLPKARPRGRVVVVTRALVRPCFPTLISHPPTGGDPDG